MVPRSGGTGALPTFVTIRCGDRDGYEHIPEDLRQAAHAHDDMLRRSGVTMGVAGDAVQVRNPEEAGVTTTPGQFMRADLPVAGFAVIEAESLEEAVDKASHSPCAVAHGVIEVWPLET